MVIILGVFLDRSQDDDSISVIYRLIESRGVVCKTVHYRLNGARGVTSKKVHSCGCLQEALLIPCTELTVGLC